MQSSSALPHASTPFGYYLRWGGLVASWILLTGAVVGVLWGLTPFEATAPHLRPNNWERTLDDFFGETSVGVGLLIGIVGGSIALFAWGYRRTRQEPRVGVGLIQQFTLANVVAVLLLGVGSAVVAFLPLHFAPPPGYGYAIKFIAKDMLVLALLGGYQVSIVRRVCQSPNS